MEILVVVIVLGVLTAIIVPQFTSAADNPQERAIRDQLRVVRAAIELYRAQHDNALPDLNNGWGPLVRQSDAQGGTSGTPLFGPYLPKPPVNALTGGTSVSGSADVARDWYWSASDASIVALDGNRQVFVESP